jgi:hypothetical protein
MDNSTDQNNYVNIESEEVNKTPEVEVKKILVTVYNREQARRCEAMGIAYKRIPQTPYVDKTKQEFKQYRKELAKAHGSKTGELKKKHINRDRILNEYLKENLK